MAHYLAQEGDAPIYQNTSVQYFPSGDTYYEELLAQVKQADTFIFLVYFIVA